MQELFKRYRVFPFGEEHVVFDTVTWAVSPYQAEWEAKQTAAWLNWRTEQGLDPLVQPA